MKKIVPYLVLIGISLLILYKIFSPGFLLFMDNPYHLSEYTYFVKMVKEHRWIYGWSPLEFAGYPIGSLYYQIGFWAIAILNLAFRIPIIFAYKILLYLAYILPALLLYYFLNKKCGSSAAALLMASLYLLIWRDVTLIILSGMWASYIALIFFMLFLIKLDSYFNKPSLRKAALLALLLSLIVLSHPLMVFAALLLLLSFLIAYLICKGESIATVIKGYMFIICIGFMAAAIFLLPIFLDFNKWMHKLGWGLGDNLFQVIYRTILPLAFAVPQKMLLSDLFNPLIAKDYIQFIKVGWLFFVASFPRMVIFLFAILGFLLFLRNRKDRMFLTAIFIFIIFSLVLTSGFWFLFPSFENLPLIGLILWGLISYKFMVFVIIGLLIFASYSLSSYRFKSKSLLLALIILFIAINFTSYQPTKDTILTSGDSMLMKKEILPLWEWIKENVDGNETRILFQSLWGNLDYISTVNAMSYWRTGVTTMGTWFNQHYPTDEFALSRYDHLLGKTVSTIKYREIERMMSMFDTKYIVAISDELNTKLHKNQALFQKEVEIGRFTVYSLVPYEPEWFKFKNRTKYEIKRFDDQNIKLEIDNKDENNEVVVKISHSPYWHAYVDGEEVEIEQDEFYLMKIKLRKIGNLDLELRYDAFNKTYLLVSLIGFLITILILLFSKKK